MERQEVVINFDYLAGQGVVRGRPQKIFNVLLTVLFFPEFSDGFSVC